LAQEMLSGREVLSRESEVTAMVVQCCVCKKVRTGHGWISEKTLRELKESISHGYCPKCAAKAFKEIHAGLSRA